MSLTCKQSRGYEFEWDVAASAKADDVNSKSKGKAIPLQALTGPEGSSRLRLPDFKTVST
jgi:hypothetical protein